MDAVDRAEIVDLVDVAGNTERTRDLAGLCERADLLFAAIGRPEFVRGG